MATQKQTSSVLHGRFEAKFAGSGHWVVIDRLTRENFFLDHRQIRGAGTWVLTKSTGERLGASFATVELALDHLLGVVVMA